MTQDESIETRVAQIEQHVSVLQNDVAVMKSDVGVLKKDITELRVDMNVLKLTSASKTDLERAKSSIIIWIVSAVFLAQLLPLLIKAVGQ